MDSQKLKQAFAELYAYMAESKKPENMMAFGEVMKEMFMWMADNKPDYAMAWLEKLEAVKWDNYLTVKEAENIVTHMDPRGPWSREQWRGAMEQHEYPLEEEPYYNKCAMFVKMSEIYSDSIESLKKIVGSGDIFEAIHMLALDKLKDKDKRYKIREYFDV